MRSKPKTQHQTPAASSQGSGEVERAGGRGPRAHRRGGEREAEEGVRVGGEALRQRVAEDHRAGDGAKREAEKIELRAADDEGDQRQDAEREGGAARAELRCGASCAD